jgi:hypothetical protein
MLIVAIVEGAIARGGITPISKADGREIYIAIFNIRDFSNANERWEGTPKTWPPQPYAV